MRQEEPENGEEEIDESGRNATQKDIDERGAEDVPVDVPWPEGGRS